MSGILSGNYHTYLLLLYIKVIAKVISLNLIVYINEMNIHYTQKVVIEVANY